MSAGVVARRRPCRRPYCRGRMWFEDGEDRCLLCCRPPELNTGGAMPPLAGLIEEPIKGYAVPVDGEAAAP